MISEAVSQRQAVRFRGRSYVAFVFSPVVPIAGWLEEIDDAGAFAWIFRWTANRA
jgi:septum site-determining protein MinC